MNNFSSINNPYRGRIAPTPSGYLHAGNISTFKIAQERAQEKNGSLTLRIEDIDKDRCKDIYLSACIEDLKKFDITCNEGYGIGGEFAPYIQSERIAFYKKNLQNLIEHGFVYQCFCSRSEIAEKSNPSAFDENEKIFPKELRNESTPSLLENFTKYNWRFKVPNDIKISFFDELQGAQTFSDNIDFGDFLVWRKSDAPSYELAVVADDIAMKITEVVRGADLLLSTAKQLLLYSALNATPPRFAHCPLVLGDNNKKLSKSTRSISD